MLAVFDSRENHNFFHGFTPGSLNRGWHTVCRRDKAQFVSMGILAVGPTWLNDGERHKMNDGIKKNDGMKGERARILSMAVIVLDN